jgi:tetratricopeptide (TPR) repeat protein
MAKKKQQDTAGQSRKTQTKKKRPEAQPKQSLNTEHQTTNSDSQLPVTNYQLPSNEQAPLTSTPARRSRYSIAQQILLGSIVLFVVILLYGFFKTLNPKMPNPEHRNPNTELRTPNSEHRIPVTDNSRNSGIEAVSLKTAETFYLQEVYEKSYAIYNKLLQSTTDASASSQEDMMRDFLLLKMALCMERMNRLDEAYSLLTTITNPSDISTATNLSPRRQSADSPVIKAFANYHLCVLEMQKKQFLKAHTYAYKTLALISALTFDWQWTSLLQQNCDFLAAESITRQVLSLCDADKNTVDKLWIDKSTSSGLLCGNQPDPFINLSETELRSVLGSGCEQLNKALLGPQIQKLQSQESPAGNKVDISRWSIICNGAPIDELLARFAANADLDINFERRTPNPEPRTTNRPVRLYMSSATTQQFLTVAAGCVGLLSRLNDDESQTPNPELRTVNSESNHESRTPSLTVKIFNPSDYTSLSEHIDLLNREAISLWRRFLFSYSNNKYEGIAHFALGLLEEQRGFITEAISEYKMVANRYSHSSLAPLALLASSKLKETIRDYAGAREDLKQLAQQYSDSEYSSQARLYLADVTMKAGLFNEAAQLFRKIFNLNLSAESQSSAALGAGKCFYEVKDYENAAGWLTRYVDITEERSNRDFYLACLLLAKTNLARGSLQQARDAFDYILTSRNDGTFAVQHLVQEYVETAMSMVKAYIQQGYYFDALMLLENTNPAEGEVIVSPADLSQKDTIEIAILKANILRSIGMVEQALIVLGDKAQYVSDSQLKAQIYLEQAKCLFAKDDFEAARKNLAEALVLTEPGPLAQQIGCELADISLKLGKDSDVISICLQVLNSEPQDPIKQKAIDLLAAAYTEKKDFDKATLALTGQWTKQSTN